MKHIRHPQQSPTTTIKPVHGNDFPHQLVEGLNSHHTKGREGIVQRSKQHLTVEDYLSTARSTTKQHTHIHACTHTHRSTHQSQCIKITSLFSSTQFSQQPCNCSSLSLVACLPPPLFTTQTRQSFYKKTPHPPFGPLHPHIEQSPHSI